MTHRMQRPRVTWGDLLPFFLGILAFIMVVGPRALQPKNIAWLANGDPAQHYLGWAFFRQSPWSFPLGLNSSYGLEFSSSLAYSDSIPLLAFIFKLFAALLPDTFQYFGLWLLACFMLQAWFGWKLVGLMSGHPLARLFATGLFVFAPPMIWRLHGHLSLVGHFTILAALYLCLGPHDLRRLFWWPLLAGTTALVHSYLLAMVLAIWLADILRRLFARESRPTRFGLEFVVVVVTCFVAVWQAGFLVVSSADWSGGGYGFYRMNLLSPIDSSGWSYLLQDLPEVKGDYEGFNYLGLGVLIAALFSVPALIQRRVVLTTTVKFWPLIVVLAGLALFALSNKIGIGSLELRIEIPAAVETRANIFRGSGRMFWPVFYTLLLFIVVTLVRGYGKRTAAVLMAIALSIQVADTSAAWRGIRAKLMTKADSIWSTPLKSEFWKQAGERYKKVRIIPPNNLTKHWSVFASYAAGHGMGTDAVYLARIDRNKLRLVHENAIRTVQEGGFCQDNLYILEEREARAALFSLDPTRDLLARVDGFLVLAPGWKACDSCRMISGEVQLGDLGPVTRLGEPMTFDSQGQGSNYLLQGWSDAGQWGTWSDGPRSEIVLPITSGVAGGLNLAIEARALVSKDHPRQEIEIAINGIDAGVLLYDIKDNERVRNVAVPTPALAQADYGGVLRVVFQHRNPVRPIDLGINADTRLLGLELKGITILSTEVD